MNTIGINMEITQIDDKFENERILKITQTKKTEKNIKKQHRSSL